MVDQFEYTKHQLTFQKIKWYSVGIEFLSLEEMKGRKKMKATIAALTIVIFIVSEDALIDSNGAVVAQYIIYNLCKHYLKFVYKILGIVLAFLNVA